MKRMKESFYNIFYSTFFVRSVFFCHIFFATTFRFNCQIVLDVSISFWTEVVQLYLGQIRVCAISRPVFKIKSGDLFFYVLLTRLELSNFVRNRYKKAAKHDRSLATKRIGESKL